MKLIDKIKNYFYDEEDDEKEIKLVNSPEDSINAKEEDIVDKKEVIVPNDEKLDAISERELFKSDPTFNFPIIFDEEDFKEEKTPKKSIKNDINDQIKIIERPKNRKFKPSPNISPVYGIISDDDKPTGSTKREDNLLNLYDEKKKVDIDDVLGKVYEQSRVDLKNENYKTIEEDTSLNNLSIDLFDNNNDKVLDEPIDKIDEKLKTIDELLENTNDEDFYSLVDSMYKEEENEEGEQ